ncbi:pyridoxal phosphate enzyme, YggS family [Methanosarcina barkeri str. Wiesmoor]|uniref:Pyridoxal phosphate enzyme, YggS family n=2 Tax=Methanosarcina barkeri TaxID=2208 RepID=A0A0E3QMW4_METBA|nr:YggS family pyridoxal phosphate-dependent enzyme [Methanosarcina barkeri]AKB51700.1 pyridoxal phosphate enzyme, YggS family [Methanosarcina barkeri str. Wiesmoor]
MIEDNVNELLKVLPPDVTLVAAVKYASKIQIDEAIKVGVTDIGFNHYQQMKDLAPYYPPEIKTHFIGTLQLNKAKKVVNLNPYLIESVDSYELAEKINNAAKENKRIQKILIQVKTDEKKHTGLEPGDLLKLLDQISTLEYLSFEGLMTIPPKNEDPEDSRKYFKELKDLKDKAEKHLKKHLQYLSMGMTDDYQIAIEEGASIVRIGRKIFKVV